MSKYIKLDDLQEFCDHQIAHEITPNDFQRMNHLEIVRCKDCIFPKNGICKSAKTFGAIVKDDWFCADGKRRTGGEVECLTAH